MRNSWVNNTSKGGAVPETAKKSSSSSGTQGGWATASRMRLVSMLVLGIVVGVGMSFGTRWQYAASTGWDAAALFFILSVWLAFARMGPAQTSEFATREDPGAVLSDLIVVLAAVASLGAIGAMLIDAQSEKGATQDLIAGLAVVSIALSWFTVHTLFTLRYARAYYTGPDGGVNFNQDEPPRYVDFAYLAFTIGMTFQVSDTDLQTPAIRALALRHALLSYLFGAVILASTINLVAGLSTSGGGGG
jgi:uncharacterized membrane protein